MTCKEPSRADVFLASELNQTRASVAKLFDLGCVKMGAKILKASTKLKIGDEISCELPEISPIKASEYEVNFSVQVLYEDEHLMVLNKPANVATHGCASLKEASLVEWLHKNNYQLANIAGSQRAGIVHRLDKPTSGALVIAKTNEAAARLSKMIASKEITRIYLAVCDLSFEGICERFIARAPNNRLKMRSLSKEQALREFGDNQAKWGRYARTEFIDCDELREQNADSRIGVLLAAKLDTGRTHQIRSALASVNRFIFADELYAPQKLMKTERLMLHSFFISFAHPFSAEQIEIFAPFDEALINAINLKKDLDEDYLKNYFKQRFSI